MAFGGFTVGVGDLCIAGVRDVPVDCAGVCLPSGVPNLPPNISMALSVPAPPKKNPRPNNAILEDISSNL